jgi:hypothetical protein
MEVNPYGTLHILIPFYRPLGYLLIISKGYQKSILFLKRHEFGYPVNHKSEMARNKWIRNHSDLIRLSRPEELFGCWI